MRKLNKFVLLTTLLILFISCHNNKTTSKNLNEVDLKIVKIPNSSDSSMESSWQKLAFQKGGCLTGGQYVRDNKFGSHRCVITDSKDWDLFFRNNKLELSHFLLKKLSDTTITEIHTCPFFSATNGELAVYCLQKIYLKNWYEFKSFKKYKNREVYGSLDSHQTWLQGILKDAKQRSKMIKHWEEEFKRN